MTTVTEPFGYFRATPFGWEDCSDEDEGAKALYEITPDQALEALGWFSRLEIAQARITELERQKTVLVEALSGLLAVVQSNHVPNSGSAQDQARAALAAVKPTGQEGGAP
jgi:hypothetical protein